jgi:hypothetical protein
VLEPIGVAGGEDDLARLGHLRRAVSRPDPGAAADDHDRLPEQPRLALVGVTAVWCSCCLRCGRGLDAQRLQRVGVDLREGREGLDDVAQDRDRNSCADGERRTT